MLKYVLFDLDGTLTKSEKGIVNSVRYAIEKAGMKVKKGDDLTQFIGPPLIPSYIKYYGMTEEQALQALYDYRDRYNPIGVYECEVFDGIYSMLDKLKEKNIVIATATSKPEDMAVRVADRFNLTERLNMVVGGTNSEDYTKADVIRQAFARLSISENDRQHTIMVGDTEFDVLGAKECGLKSIGVGYGYGKKENILSAGADYFVNTVDELENLLLKII